jgi:hypothetical protein
MRYRLAYWWLDREYSRRYWHGPGRRWRRFLFDAVLGWSSRYLLKRGDA